jgi:hypothetical protein
MFEQPPAAAAVAVAVAVAGGGSAAATERHFLEVRLLRVRSL